MSKALVTVTEKPFQNRISPRGENAAEGTGAASDILSKPSTLYDTLINNMKWLQGKLKVDAAALMPNQSANHNGMQQIWFNQMHDRMEAVDLLHTLKTDLLPHYGATALGALYRKDYQRAMKTLTTAPSYHEELVYTEEMRQSELNLLKNMKKLQSLTIENFSEYTISSQQTTSPRGR
jgi:hypothetical protein